MNHYKNASSGAQNGRTKKSGATIGIILLCAVFIAGIILAGIYLFLRPSLPDGANSDSDNDQLVTNNAGGYGQDENDDGKVYRSGDGNGSEDNVTVNGNENGGDGDGAILRRAGANGKTEYSTDGGKTWSEKVPEGVHEPKIK